MAGMPDYGTFINALIAAGRSLDFATASVGLGYAGITLTIVLALYQFMLGNKAGGQMAMVRAFAALLILNLAVNQGIANQLWSAWKSAHKIGVQYGAAPLAQGVNNALANLRDTAKAGIVAAGTIAIGVVALRASKAGTEILREIGEKMGDPKLRRSAVGIASKGASAVKQASLAAMSLLATYNAAMLLAASMSYFALLFMPLGAGLLALGQSRFLVGLLGTYLAGVLLALANPMLLGAGYQLLQSTSIAQLQRSFQQAINAADAAKQQSEQAAQSVYATVDDVAAQVPSDMQNKSRLQQFLDGARDKIQQGWQSVKQAYDQVAGAIDRGLTAVANWITTGLLAVLAFLITYGGIILGTFMTIGRLSSIFR